MTEWHTHILPLVLGPPIVITFVMFYYVIPAWFKSFDEDNNETR